MTWWQWFLIGSAAGSVGYLLIVAAVVRIRRWWGVG